VDALGEPDADEAPGDADELYSGLEAYTGPLRLAMLGRPNAGKSSLVNALVGAERMMVSDVAGTTRDSVDVSAEVDGEPCTFVDTAGVRRRGKITDTVERYSVNSSLKSTSKAHVTILVLDASQGLAVQDKRLIDLMHERKTPFMVLVNKSDLLDHKLRSATERRYREALTFCPHVPLLFVSAKNRHNLNKIVPLAKRIRKECGVRISTGKLNRAMVSVLERHQPPLVRRLRPKFFYLTQAEKLPPTFVFFVNDAERVKESYARYLERSLRKIFGIAHAPMRVNFRSAHSKKNKK
jgi:GTP-binding protein